MSENTITLIIAIVTGVKWLYEYTKQIRWTRDKYLVERIDSFKAKESTKKMQLLLDWNSIEIELNGTKTVVTDDILIEALETHDNRSKFSKSEVELRKIFDDYFDGLNEFVLLCNTGLINEKHLRVYFKYWFKILNGEANNKPKKLISQLEKYLLYYGYYDLLFFI